MPPVAVPALPEILPATPSDAKIPARKWAGWLYIGAVTAVGGLLLIRFTPRTFSNVLLTVALLGASLLLSNFKLRLPLWRGVSTMSMACAADLLALMILGADVAMLTSSAGVLLQCTLRVRRSQPLYRAAFSVASVAITVQTAGLVWRVLAGDLAGPTLVPLAATTATYFLVNTGLVATAIGLSNGLSPLRAWYWEFFWSAPSYFLSGAAAGVVGLIVIHEEYLLLPSALVPLYVSYRAYQLSLRRIDEERRHAAELSRAVVTTQAALARAQQSEAALAAEKERLVLESSRLSVTVQTIRDGVMMVDRDGSILLMNDEARRLATVAPGQPGERPIVAMLASLGFSTPAHEDALRLLQDGKAVRLVNDVAPDGRIPLVEVSGTPTRNAEGDVAGAVWVLRDITHIARAEQERAKAAQLQSLGVLAGGLAHDFNNILTGIVGNLSLAQDLVHPDQGALRTRLDQAAAASARARGVTSQLLTFSKGGSPIKTTASIGELVIECTRFVLSGSPVAPRFGVPDDAWHVDVDTNQIAQVVHNLVLNAMQVMPRGGVVDVSLENVDLTADTLPANTRLTPGRYVCLTVLDQGSGIPSDAVNRIFDPYFTTKEKGSGLGLAITYSIVRAHGGAIRVESKPGEGATFIVYLPASTRPAVKEVDRRPTEVRRAGGRVLLMDDDAMVAEVAQEMLQSLGFVTEVAVSGDDALERFRSAEDDGAPFDIAILDLTVPGGMGGAEAVRHIREIRSDILVFVTSGYADDAVLARFQEYGFDGVLPKPFAVSDLRRALAVG
ncbi:MAG TPA: ATP-binding protein [Vicinamibacterales bacterium]